MRHFLPVVAETLLALVVAFGTADGAPVLRWTPTGPSVAIGGDLTLSIMLDEAVAVRTLEVYVTYDSALVTSVTGTPGALFAGHNLFAGFEEVTPAAPGRWHAYCVILGAGDWAVGPGELYRWTLHGVAAGACALNVTGLTLLPPGGGNYPEVALVPSTVTVVDPASAVSGPPPGSLPPSLTPNPFNPLVRIDCDPGSRLMVLDARGAVVCRLEASGMAGERLTFVWEGTDQRGMALPSGVYLFSATSPDGARTVTRGTLLR